MAKVPLKREENPAKGRSEGRELTDTQSGVGDVTAGAGSTYSVLLTDDRDVCTRERFTRQLARQLTHSVIHPTVNTLGHPPDS